MITLLAMLALMPVLILASLPTWPYSTKWTYLPSATLSIATLSLLMLIVTGRL